MDRSSSLRHVAAGAVLFLGACNLPLFGEDPPQIVQRYETHYSGTCTSWLTSPRTGLRYCASPAIELKVESQVAAPAKPAYDETKTDKDSLMAAGEKVYGSVCANCHQPDGKGKPGMFPPLAGSGEFYGDAQNMAKIVVHGLSGEIVVQGQTFNSAMPAQGAALSDYELAAAMTFVRHSWGNDDGVVLPTDVAAVR